MQNATTQPKQPQPQTQAVAMTPKQFQEETMNKVMAQINAFSESGELKLPKDYSPQNAIRAAWLLLQDTKDRNDKLALDVCTKDSICNALLKMVVWGLSPLKKQCDFIVYGNKLSCDPEYTGNIVLAKRYGNLKDYNASAIFKGDVFEFEVESEFPYRKRIVKHEQKLENIGGEVIGAYFAYELTTGEKNVEIMNITQIRNAWAQGAGKGNTRAHNNFSDQMAIKTVINRGCKLLIRASDDSALMIDDETEDANRPDPAKAAADHERQQNANKKEMSFDDAEVVDDPKQEAASKKQTESAGDQENPEF